MWVAWDSQRNLTKPTGQPVRAVFLFLVIVGGYRHPAQRDGEGSGLFGRFQQCELDLEYELLSGETRESCCGPLDG